MSALDRILWCERQKLGKEQNGRREQTFCRIVEEGVLSVVGGIALGVDNGLGEDLGVFFRLGSGGKVVRLLSGDVHIAVDQSQQIIAVRAGGVSQVDHRHIVAVVFLRNRAIVSGQVALGVQCQEAHAAGAGIFQIGIQKERRFSHAAGADHQAVNIVVVHQRCHMVFAACAAKDESLLLGAVVTLPPTADIKGNVGIGVPDFFLRRPTSRPVLTVAHGAGFDSVEGIVVG